MMPQLCSLYTVLLSVDSISAERKEKDAERARGEAEDVDCDYPTRRWKMVPY